ncbi:MAG TPA: rhodanese-like domain-containing protein [Acidimicrobiales bacterium]|nr:rhodanese-like domain-containing protein [Acidimicrobiales bacterium]
MGRTGGGGDLAAGFVTLPGLLVDADWLAVNRHPCLAVLDATVVLAPPSRDGDYRAESGHAGFLAGHIPGARHADLLGRLSDPLSACHFTRPAAAELASALAELGVLDGIAVVTYDTVGGIWAARLWWMLRWIGLPAAVLDGGLQAWVARGGELESGAASAHLPRQAGRPAEVDERAGMWADRGEVARIASGAASSPLVCALSTEVFDGSVPTRYARRGHIPRSVNVPARSLLGPSGRFLAGKELEDATAAVGFGEPVTVYCGAGVSAAVVALALTLQGRENVAIYDGSLEEWSACAALPLELGPAPARRC